MERRTVVRAGLDKLKDLVGPSRARTKQLDQDMRSMDMRTCKCVKNKELFEELSCEKTAMTIKVTAGEAARVSRRKRRREKTWTRPWAEQAHGPRRRS